MKSKKLTWASIEKTRTIWRDMLEKYALWALVFAVTVVFLNLPSEGIKWDDYSEGVVVTEDIILLEDIQVEDVEATELQREEARKAVKPVFDYNPLQATHLLEKLTTYFALKREEVKQEETEKVKGPERSVEIILTDEILEFFRKEKFSEELEASITSLIPKVYRNPIVANKNFLMSLHSTGYVQQMITTGREKETFDVFNPKGYPDEVGEYLTTELQAVRGYTRQQKTLVRKFLLDNIQPNLTYNALQTQNLREKADSSIHMIIHNYTAGTVITQRGEKLSREDFQVLNVLRRHKRESRHWTHQIGILLYALLAILFFVIVVRLRKVTLYGESPGMTLGVTLIITTLFLVMVKLLTVFSLKLSFSFTSFPFDQKILYFYAIPFALGASIIQLISGYPLVVAFSIVFSHFAAMITGNYSTFFPFILAGSLAVALALHRLRSRSDVTKAGIILGGINVSIVVMQILVSQDNSGPRSILITMLFAFFGGILTAILVSFFAPIFETLFGVTSDLRLLELSTATHPLLRQLALSASGTYIHSFNMSLLAERAAEEVGADPLIVRVGCLFHDIGKIKQPHYFIENQRGLNPHQQLQPGMSRMVLRNHVLKGVEMARQYHLPQIVKDAILQHHGKKLMTYFYEAAKEKEQSSLEDTDYRYSGPLPQTLEMGIILLADAVEASARSLEDPSPAKFSNVVLTIIKRSIDDGQLVDCPVTLQDLRKIEMSFAETLTSMHHNRIAYPGYDFELQKRENGKNGDRNPEEKEIQDPGNRNNS